MVDGIDPQQVSLEGVDETISILGEGSIEIRSLNAFQLAISQGNTIILKLLLDAVQTNSRGIFSARNAELVVEREGKQYAFANWALALVFCSQKVDILITLLKHPAFVLIHQDLTAFTDLALALKWFTGMKSFMTSTATHFAFASLKFDD